MKPSFCQQARLAKPAFQGHALLRPPGTPAEPGPSPGLLLRGKHAARVLVPLGPGEGPAGSALGTHPGFCCPYSVLPGPAAPGSIPGLRQSWEVTGGQGDSPVAGSSAVLAPGVWRAQALAQQGLPRRGPGCAALGGAGCLLSGVGATRPESPKVGRRGRCARLSPAECHAPGARGRGPPVG